MRFTYLVPYLAVSLLGSLNLLGGLVDVLRTTTVALWSTFVGPLFVRAPRVHGITDEEQRHRHARAMLKARGDSHIRSTQRMLCPDESPPTPQEFANRLLRLVPMLTYVGCMSARRVASATSQLLTLSSLDTQYSKQHATRMESAQSIQTVVEGFSEGLAALVLALQDSVTGVVYKPYIGYREGRARGAFWGAAQGVLGLSKAFVGLADFAAKVAEGLSEMSRPFTLLAGTELQRLQPPLACRWTRLVHEVRAAHICHNNNSRRSNDGGGDDDNNTRDFARSTTRARRRRTRCYRAAPSTCRTRSPSSTTPTSTSASGRVGRSCG